MRTDSSDAATLRDAARILRNRASRRTVMLRVVTGFLEMAAARIDRAVEWDVVTGRGTHRGLLGT